MFRAIGSALYACRREGQSAITIILDKHQRWRHPRPKPATDQSINSAPRRSSRLAAGASARLLRRGVARSNACPASRMTTHCLQAGSWSHCNRSTLPGRGSRRTGHGGAASRKTSRRPVSRVRRKNAPGRGKRLSLPPMRPLLPASSRSAAIQRGSREPPPGLPGIRPSGRGAGGEIATGGGPRRPRWDDAPGSRGAASASGRKCWSGGDPCRAAPCAARCALGRCATGVRHGSGSYREAC